MAKFGPAFEVAMQHEVSPAFTLATANDFANKGFVILPTGEVNKWGLTLSTLKSLNLIPPDVAADSVKAEAFVKAMTPGFIEDAYASEFWCAARYKTQNGDWISSLQEITAQVIASKAFDCMVHRGVWGGGTILQEAVNLVEYVGLVVDGRVGNRTVDAVNMLLLTDTSPISLLAALCIRYRRQLEMVIEKNPSDKQFEKDWFERAKWPFATQPTGVTAPFPEVTVIV